MRTSGSGAGPGHEIPDKLYFRIGEVAKLCGVPAYVLRFWETEFPQLHPNKGGTGQRLYRRRDVEMALRIKALLYDEGYTIAGARQAFKQELRASKDPKASPLAVDAAAETPRAGAVDAKHLQAIRKELRDIQSMLARPAAAKAAVQEIRGAKAAAVTTMARPAPRAIPKPISLDEAFATLFDGLDEPLGGGTDGQLDANSDGSDLPRKG
jgi:DNA-binding transcriptional MerR regulator